MRLTLSRRLTLEAPTRVSDGGGGFSTSWTILGFLWAAVVPALTREGADAAGTRAQAALRITVRGAPPDAPSRPRPGQRLRDGTRRYRIIAVTEADPFGRRLHCQAEEEVAG